MQPTLLQLAQQTSPQGAIDGASRAFMLLLVLVAIAFGAIAALSIAWLMRRSRLRAESLRRAKGTSNARSAWQEAGERAATPSAFELELAHGERGNIPEPEHSAVDKPTPQPLVDVVRGEKPAQSLKTSQPNQRPIALVTGGARRVGSAIALELASHGCDLIITYRTSASDAEQTAKAAANLGATATLFQVDLSDVQATMLFCKQVLASFRRLDILVHNAATFSPDACPTGQEQPSPEYQMAVNAMAPFYLTMQLRPLLERSTLAGGASVIALTDIHAMGKPRAGFAAYSMSKAALTELVHCLARDLAPKVRVNAVAPGVLIFPERGVESDPAMQREYVKQVPLGRAGKPIDAARMVRWLALEAPYVTGAVLRLDGGRWLT